MSDGHSNDGKIHISNTFTELFHLLKKLNLFNGCFNSDEASSELNSILVHSDNALTGILHGLQAIGNLVATSTLIEKEDVVHLGYFLTLISNLMEALNILRSDCEYQLYENETENVQTNAS